MIELLLSILIGLCGSWLVNYLSDVLPDYMKITAPRCRNCKESIFLVDYLLLRNCRHCHTSRSIRAWLITIGLPLAGILVWYFHPGRLDIYMTLGLVIYFSLVAIIDLEHKLVLLPVTIAGLALSAYAGSILHGLWITLAGGAAGFAIMLGLYFFGILFMRLFSRIHGQPSNEPALGSGDISVTTILGLLLGWPGITAGIFLGIMFGGLASGLILFYFWVRKNYQPFLAIPYTPFLIFGAFLLLFR